MHIHAFSVLIFTHRSQEEPLPARLLLTPHTAGLALPFSRCPNYGEFLYTCSQRSHRTAFLSKTNSHWKPRFMRCDFKQVTISEPHCKTRQCDNHLGWMSCAWHVLESFHWCLCDLTELIIGIRYFRYRGLINTWIQMVRVCVKSSICPPTILSYL